MNRWHYTGFDDHCGIGRPYYGIIDDLGFKVINQNGIVNGRDAPLLAASPELLDACKEVLRLLNKCTIVQGHPAGIKELLESAIDKANLEP